MKSWRHEDLTLLTDEELNRQSDVIVEKIRPLLAGKHPGVQGVVLCDLLAMWIAGHHPAAEKELLANHMVGARKLVPLYRKVLGTETEEPFT